MYRSFVSSSLLVALLALSAAAEAGAQPAPIRAKSSEVPVWLLPPATNKGVKGAAEGGGYVGPQAVLSAEPWSDPVAQTWTSAPTEALNELSAPLVQFAGQTGGTPPDTVGDVGPNHYVQMVNTTFRIWDKQGNPLTQAVAINSLWAAAGGQCQTQNAGDPFVLYDQEADRWMLSQFTTPATTGAGPFEMCIAYSQTPDPTGLYHLYEFALPFGNDYEKYGIWPDGLYMSTFQGGSSADNDGAYVFDRASMLNGAPACYQYFNVADTGGGGPRGFRILPSDWDGATPPPAGSPNYFVRSADFDVQGGGAAFDRLEVYEFHTDWQAVPCTANGTPSPNSTFTLVSNLATAGFSIDLNCADADGDGAFRDCIPQPATAQQLDDLANRLMSRLQYRNFGTHEAMVVNQTVDAGADRAGVRWYELRKSGAGAWAIQQQATYAPGTPDRWMGSAAMDRRGNIALGYSIVDAGANLFPSIRYVGRLESAPLGLMPEPEMTLFTGTSSQTNADRWGDYSAMNVDPVDDCTFWYTQEHSGTRATRIGSFRFNSCNQTDLSVTKSDSPDPVNAGEQLFYDVSVANYGADTAYDVVVTDTLPLGVDYVTDTGGCAFSAGTGLGGEDQLTCQLGDILAGGLETFTIKAHIPSDFVVNTGPVSIENGVAVASDWPDVNPADNTATATTIVEDQADLAVTKLCKPDGPIAAGATATCTIYVDNLGPSDARDVELRDTLVANGSFMIGTVTPSQGVCGPPAGGVITCNLDDLPAASTTESGRATVTVALTASEATDINDVATVIAATPDSDTSNNQATGSVSVTAVADLALSKSDSEDPLTSGTVLTYTLEVTNNGPSTAVNVVITDDLPAGVSILSVASSGGTCNAGVPGDPLRPTTCTFDSIAPGGNESMTLQVNVDPGVLNFAHNDARVSSDVFDPDNSNDLATEETTIQVADLEIRKTSDFDVYKPSSTVQYVVTVTNHGPADAANVVVTDNLPAVKKAIYQTDTGGCTKSGLVLTCDMGTVPASTSKTFNVYVTIRGKKGIVTNSASSTSTTADPTPSNNSSTRVILIKGGLR